jgi:hypothetical protein
MPASHIASYYAASANPSPCYAALEGDIDADVCVIGGGMAGCSAALHLAERGYREEVSQLTPEMLKDGSWRNVRFRPYYIGLNQPRMQAGKKSAYGQFLQFVKTRLLAMGFTGANEAVKKAFDGRTEADGLFLCGDMRTGQSLVVKAMADGLAVAEKIDGFLSK